MNYTDVPPSAPLPVPSSTADFENPDSPFAKAFVHRKNLNEARMEDMVRTLERHIELEQPLQRQTKVFLNQLQTEARQIVRCSLICLAERAFS
ncbi:hypothetical protein JCM6882_002392 [Rhodosporidiobolus microsporus]